MENQSIKEIFFEECEDLVAELSEGLSTMASGDTDPEVTNTIFRAVHSIKGGAGAFGLDILIEFSHKFETVLDQIRTGQTDVNEALLTVLQSSGDVLSDLIENAREGNEEETEALRKVAQDLESYLDEAETETPDSLDFVPNEIGNFFDLQVESDTQEESRTEKLKIKVSPTAKLLSNGHDPLFVLKTISDFGTLESNIAKESIPGQKDFDYLQCHISWNLVLETEYSISEIDDALDFVKDLCEIEYNADEDSARKADEREEKTTPLPTRTERQSNVSAKETAPKVKKIEKRETIRVDVMRIERLVNLVGELIVNQAIIEEKLDELEGNKRAQTHTEIEDYKQLARDIQEGVMSLRTQPVKSLFQKMSRVVREASAKTDKEIKFEIEGEWTEVDKKVTEKLSDPLTHMIRNSVDHGIESPEDRLANGKDTRGTIKLCAKHKSGNVVITLEDDGAGLNRDKILSLAKEKGLIPNDIELTEQQIDELLFLPGFSTAKEVTNLSGRGVGMDVVRTSIDQLGGKIKISSVPGQGTKIKIELPLTLAVMDGMVVTAGEQIYIIPISNVIEAIQPKQSDFANFDEKKALLKFRDEFLPVLDLSERFEIPSSPKSASESVYLILSASDHVFALQVDSVADQKQFVIKSIEVNYGSITGVSAATIMGDGNVALIVDPDSLLNCISETATYTDKPIDTETGIRLHG